MKNTIDFHSIQWERCYRYGLTNNEHTVKDTIRLNVKFAMSLLASVSDKLHIWNFQKENDAENYTLSTCNECVFDNGVRTADLWALTWNHNQQVVAVGGNDSKIHLVQASSGKVLTSLPENEEDQFVGIVGRLSFSHSSRYLASSIDKTIKVWDLKKRNLRATLTGHNALIKDMHFSPAESVVVSGDVNGVLKLWNVDSATSSDNLTVKTGLDASSLNCMKFLHSNHHHLACGYGDGSMALWNMETTSVIRLIDHVHRGPVTDISISPKNDRLVATAGQDGYVHLNDLLAKSPSGGDNAAGSHPCAAMSLSIGEHVTAISFHESAVYMGVGTLSGYIQIYDWRSPRKPLCIMPAHNPHPVKQLIFQKSTPVVKPPSAKKSRRQPEPTVNTRLSGATSIRPDDVEADLTAASRPPRPLTSPPPHSASKDDQASAAQPFTRSNFPPSPTLQQPQPAEVVYAGEDGNVEEKYVPGRTFQTGSSATTAASTTSTKTTNDAGRTKKQTHRDDQSTLKTGVNTTTMTVNRVVPSETEEELRRAVKPVTNQHLEESLQLLKYDIHREIQTVLKEQVRQFAIAREEMNATVSKLSVQLEELLIANKELRDENERLRHIY